MARYAPLRRAATTHEDCFAGTHHLPCVEVLAPWFLVASCSDPSLSVVFQIDEAYRDAVSSVTVRIYEPVPAAPFTCEDLAFGLVDEDVLRLSQVSEISLSLIVDGPLGEVTRVDPKVFWADGLDGDGRRVVTGCAELGEIAGREELVIRGEPTKVVSSKTESITIPVGGTLLDPVVVQVTDLDRNPLSGVEVRWEIDGAGGSGSKGTATSDGGGNAEILPAPPARPGPFVLDVAVRWAERVPDPVTGFVTPTAETGFLPGRVLDYRAGDIGPNGEPGFVALVGPDFVSYQVASVYVDETGLMRTRLSQSISISGPALGLIEAPAAGVRDRPIVVGVDEWVEIDMDGDLLPRVYSAPLPGATPTGVFMSAPCEPGSTPQVFVDYFDDVVGIYNDMAQGNGFGATFDVVDAGCVSESSTRDVRALVLSIPNGNLAVVTIDGDQLPGEAWFALPFGTAFTPEVGGDRLLIGTQLQVNDVVVTRFAVTTGPGTLELVQRGLDSPPPVPIVNRGTDIDEDDALDIISLIERPVPIGAPREFALWAALGRERQGKRITGDFDLEVLDLRDPEMLVVDLDKDGTDDIVVGERTELDLVSQTRFFVFPMGE
jgi:hypothetical protein